MSLYLIALGIGIVAGLRTMTAPVAVSWAAYLGWLNLQASPLKFLEHGVTVVILSVLAVGEYIADLLPIGSRTAPGPLIARIVTGALSGAAIFAGSNASLAAGAACGGIGAILGSFGGYEARMRLVNGLKVKDAIIGISEDLFALAVAYLLVR